MQPSRSIQARKSCKVSPSRTGRGSADSALVDGDRDAGLAGRRSDRDRRRCFASLALPALARIGEFPRLLAAGANTQTRQAEVSHEVVASSRGASAALWR